MNARLILMLKYPRTGEVKTRLVAALGERRACELYRAMVRHTLNEAQRFAAESGASLTVRVAGDPDNDAVREWLGDSVHFQPQGGGDLGQRMERAVHDAFSGGASSVIVIGADCPALTAESIDTAFRALASHQAVFGPAADGGYYLIGVRRLIPEFFCNIPWSTNSVLEETLVAANRLGIECGLLDILHDIDLPDDLPQWAQSLPAQSAGKGKISVVIPALNEAHNLPRTLEAAQRCQPHEIIVVDGGSTDETVKIARSKDCIVLIAPRCRAVQMNRGAVVATGEYLLFLHADTLLPDDYLTHVKPVLGQPGVAAGAFEFSVSGDFAGRRLVESTANWRARQCQFPYGDQALFLRREVFGQLGGFPEIPIMEDYEFVRRLRRLGKIVIAPSPAVTSGRRWQEHGWMWPTILNKIIILAYRLGVSPARLAGWYRGHKANVSSPQHRKVSGSSNEVLGIKRQPGGSHL
jgi:uncharacterized protein